MAYAAAKVINIDEMRRKKSGRTDILALHSTHQPTAAATLSFNIANLLFANLSDSSGQKIRERDPDLQAALFFARARLQYLEGRYHDAGKIFQAVLTMAEGDDLRALALLALSNCYFSMGDFLRAGSCLEMNSLNFFDLPDAIRMGLWLQKGNIAFASGAGSATAAAYYRKVFSEQSRSLWVQCLQQTLVGFNPVSLSEVRPINLRGLRNLLDAFIEVGAGRYYASLVLTFS